MCLFRSPGGVRSTEKMHFPSSRRFRCPWHQPPFPSPGMWITQPHLQPRHHKKPSLKHDFFLNQAKFFQNTLSSWHFCKTSSLTYLFSFCILDLRVVPYFVYYNSLSKRDAYYRQGKTIQIATENSSFLSPWYSGEILFTSGFAHFILF